MNEYPYVLNLSDEDLNYIIKLVSLINDLLNKKKPDDKMTLKMILLAIISFLSVRYSINTPKTYKIELLSKATYYMQENINQNIKIAEIAMRCCVSTRQLNRLFNEYYGTSPIEYYTKVRLETAFSLICKSDMQIKQAAYNCGFDDNSYFFRVFKRHYGFTPHEIALHIK